MLSSETQCPSRPLSAAVGPDAGPGKAARVSSSRRRTTRSRATFLPGWNSSERGEAAVRLVYQRTIKVSPQTFHFSNDELREYGSCERLLRRESQQPPALPGDDVMG